MASLDLHELVAVSIKALKIQSKPHTTNGTDAEERARLMDPVDLKGYRSKLSEMGLLSGENKPATPCERELGNMVLSLLDAQQWDPTQLLEQALTISRLMQE
ncbi:hypothetical protein IW262DRAFT_1558558 [Armillaria fumosa]|nr:hypothetical protein IW262DRAFT_1558558 [Armillaria fumosa]